MPTAQETAEYLNMPLDKYEKVLSKANLFYILSLDMLMEEKAETDRQSRSRHIITGNSRRNAIWEMNLKAFWPMESEA